MEPTKLKLVPVLALLGLVMACEPNDPVQPDEPEQPIEDPDERPDAGEATAFRSGQESAPDQRMAASGPREAVAEISAVQGSGVSGTLRFVPQDGLVHVRGTVTGLEPGEHGLHVHVNGDCSAPDASAAGDHFAPEGDPHGAPTDPPAEHHLGDLGNIVAGEDGTATIEKQDDEISMQGEQSVVGRAVIVHAGRDDLTSQPSGDAGDPVGCGVIEPAQASAAEGDSETPADSAETIVGSAGPAG